MSLRKEYPKRIGPAAMPTGIAASVYHAPERVLIRQFTFSNTTASLLAVTVYVVTASSGALATNQIIPAVPVSGNDTISIEAPIVLEAGEHIFALASGDVNLTFNVNDREAEII